MPGKKGKGGGGVGRGKSLYTFSDQQDVKDIRQEQWTDADYIETALKISKAINLARAMRLETLRQRGFHIRQTAKYLGIPEATLRYDIKCVRNFFTHPQSRKCV